MTQYENVLFKTKPLSPAAVNRAKLLIPLLFVSYWGVTVHYTITISGTTYTFGCLIKSVVTILELGQWLGSFAAQLVWHQESNVQGQMSEISAVALTTMVKFIFVDYHPVPAVCQSCLMGLILDTWIHKTGRVLICLVHLHSWTDSITAYVADKAPNSGLSSVLIGWEFVLIVLEDF